MENRAYRLLKIGLLANAFEWYEFSVYGFLARIIGQLFFGTDQPIIATIKAFSVFALSYLARPLGAFFFGFLSDQISRRYSLKLSLVMMAVPTVLIGLLPTYHQIGILASLLLVGLRLIQGFAAGGELPASACYIFESARDYKYRSILYSSVSIGQTLGILSGACISFLLMDSFNQTQLLTWAWRIPFLLGIPITLFIVYIRSSIQEPNESLISSQSIKINVLQHWIKIRLPLIQAVCLFSFLITCYYIVAVWMPYYLNLFLGIPEREARLTNIATQCAIVPFYGIMGWLSQCYGYRQVILFSTAIICLLVLPIFKSFQLVGSFWGLLWLQLLFAFFMSSTGLIVEVLGNLFTDNSRGFGMSAAIAIPSSLIGGITPLILTQILHKTGWLLFSAFYILFFGLLALPVALRLKVPLKSPI